jgi:alpha-N-arabinofuranosidase
LTVFALNRSLTEEMPLQVRLDGFMQVSVDSAMQLHDANLEAVNTEASSQRVRPMPLAVQMGNGAVSTTLRPASWNVIRLKTS